jgi:hypothetical protein
LLLLLQVSHTKFYIGGYLGKVKGSKNIYIIIYQGSTCSSTSASLCVFNGWCIGGCFN